MKVYISADMEGATGVTHSQDVVPGRPEYGRFRHLLTADVNAAIQGAAQGGATEFVVNEAHNGMRNLIIEDLDSRAELIVGNRKPLAMMEGVAGCDVALFVGYHGRAGSGGILSHTFRVNQVIGVELDGLPCSEGRMNAELAGVYDAPVGLVTGDDVTCSEAQSLYTGVYTAQVKTAIDRYSARCLTPEKSHETIVGEAQRAIEGWKDLSPYIPQPPHTFTVEFANASLAAGVMYFPGLERVDECRVQWTHEDYETAYKMFIGIMKLAVPEPDFG